MIGITMLISSSLKVKMQKHAIWAICVQLQVI